MDSAGSIAGRSVRQSSIRSERTFFTFFAMDKPTFAEPTPMARTTPDTRCVTEGSPPVWGSHRRSAGGYGHAS